MKRWLILAVAIAGTMALTNPTQSDYIDWAAKRMSSRLQRSVCRKSSLPEALRHQSAVGACSLGVSLFYDVGLADLVLDHTTQRWNLGIFSIYETRLPEQTIKTVGIFGHFISVGSPRFVRDRETILE